MALALAALWAAPNVQSLWVQRWFNYNIYADIGSFILNTHTGIYMHEYKMQPNE